MHRTNIYLTDEQERALDARAQVAGSTRSAVLRAILDDALATDDRVDASLDAAFAAIGEQYSTVTAGLFDEDEDLRIS